MAVVQALDFLTGSWARWDRGFRRDAMPPNNLVQQLGEISGQLSHVVPALERMEERLVEMGRELTEVKTNLKNNVDQFAEYKESAGEQFSILSSELRTATQTNLDQAKEIQILKDKVESRGKRGWEIFMIVVSGLFGALLTWLASKFSFSKGT